METMIVLGDIAIGVEIPFVIIIMEKIIQLVLMIAVQVTVQVGQIRSFQYLTIYATVPVMVVGVVLFIVALQKRFVKNKI